MEPADRSVMIKPNPREPVACAAGCRCWPAHMIKLTETQRSTPYEWVHRTTRGETSVTIEELQNRPVLETR